MSHNLWLFVLHVFSSMVPKPHHFWLWYRLISHFFQPLELHWTWSFTSLLIASWRWWTKLNEIIRLGTVPLIYCKLQQALVQTPLIAESSLQHYSECHYWHYTLIFQQGLSSKPHHSSGAWPCICTCSWLCQYTSMSYTNNSANCCTNCSTLWGPFRTLRFIRVQTLASAHALCLPTNSIQIFQVVKLWLQVKSKTSLGRGERVGLWVSIWVDSQEKRRGSQV